MTDTRWLSTEDAAQLFGLPSADQVLMLLYLRSWHWDEEANAPTQAALSLGVVKRGDDGGEWLWQYPFLKAVGVYWQVPGLRDIADYSSPAHAVDLIGRGIAQVVEANPAWAGSDDERRQKMGENAFHIAELMQDPDIFLTICARDGLLEALEQTAKLYAYLRAQVDQTDPAIASGLRLAESGIGMASEIGSLHPFVRYELLSIGKPSRRRQPSEPLNSDRIYEPSEPVEQEDWMLKLRRYLSESGPT